MLTALVLRWGRGRKVLPLHQHRQCTGQQTLAGCLTPSIHLPAYLTDTTNIMAINPQINDMAWFGKPADPVDSFQKGMNLAEQSQRIKQSADMHPLKMADLQSATAARDANTNLSKQSYRFNELTEADRVSSVNALARLQQVSAGIAENTQEAVESLKKSQAWNQKRSDKITKKVDIELEVQAREAERNRVITNQWVNEQTKQGQVNQFNQRTNLLELGIRLTLIFRMMFMVKF